MEQKTVPDANDILYDTYNLDLAGGIQAFVKKIIAFFQSGGSSGDGVVEGFLSSLESWWNVFSIIALILALLFFAGFIYARIRLAQLAEIEDRQLLEAEKAWGHAYGNTEKENDRWKDVQQHIASDNPADWRLGIIEADILLEEALDEKGYIGVSVGDKLKTVNATAVQSLQDVWDAHLIRNKITHSGSDFIFTKRMANEAVVKYERFLREIGAL